MYFSDGMGSEDVGYSSMINMMGLLDKSVVGGGYTIEWYRQTLEKQNSSGGLHKRKRYRARRKEDSTLEGARFSVLKECGQSIREPFEK